MAASTDLERAEIMMKRIREQLEAGAGFKAAGVLKVSATAVPLPVARGRQTAGRAGAGGCGSDYGNGHVGAGGEARPETRRGSENAEQRHTERNYSALSEAN